MDVWEGERCVWCVNESGLHEPYTSIVLACAVIVCISGGWVGRGEQEQEQEVVCRVTFQ